MTLRCIALGSGRVDRLYGVVGFQDFPGGSEYLRAPHWHVIYGDGFRTNLPKSLYVVAKVR